MTFYDIVLQHYTEEEYKNCLEIAKDNKLFNEKLKEVWDNTDDFYRDNLLYSVQLANYLPLTEVKLSSLLSPSSYVHSLSHLFRYTYKNVLDFGSGMGINGFQFLNYGYNVDFADIDSPHFNILKDIVVELNKVDNTTAQTHLLPDFLCKKSLPNIFDTRYDVVICTQVMEHIADPEGALELFHQILSPSGLLVLEVFFDDVGGKSPYHLHSNMEMGYNIPMVWQSILIEYGFKPLVQWDTGEWRVLRKVT